MRTSEALHDAVAEALKPFNISGTQYNVLRILRGSGPGGLMCGEIAERMVNRDPDVTRLLDRLDKAGLIARSRDKADRRVIRTIITPAGIKLIDEADAPLTEMVTGILSHMGDANLRQFIDLLELAREKTSWSRMADQCKQFENEQPINDE
jgi:DNA-binding MarR family transcriptional regulator